MSVEHVIAIVGFGGMGSQHGKILSGISRIKVAGIYDILETRQQFAIDKGFYVYKSYEEILQDSTVNTVLIATPNDSHRDIAIAALKAGKHVICEKPVTLNSRQLEEIIETAETYNKVFVVHQNRRWDEDYLVMKKLYDEGILGDVFHLETRVQGSRGIPGDWRHQKEFGGGMMLDWGVHLIDRLLIMIKEKITSLQCKMSYVLGNDVDDGFRLTINFESGKTAFVEVGTCNYITLPKWYMCGTTGTAIIEDWEMNGQVITLKTFNDKDATPIEAGAGLTKTMAPRELDTVNTNPIPRFDTDVREFYHNFIDVTEGKGEILVKNEEVLRVMKVIEAAFLSDELNQVVLFD
ncbi:Gfo/Idh/MocA family protein [Robertmurraya sp.]|jgi:scyllo-inositol 2-dehydrogenase (NADP+)|uniref:Gfo/Idh/MocA family protein n=1 Tax=Robertmurraya sp. TaxID=2837525 RepID=UPI003703D105